MDKAIEKQVEALLEKGLSKEEIKKKLLREGNEGELIYHLKQIPYPEDKKRFKVISYLLLCILLFITLKKLAFVLSFGVFNFYILLLLVVPAINIYLFIKIVKFKRMGYQFLAILSIISLVNAENRQLPEIILIPIMSGLSGYLLWKMFIEREKQERLE